jgi:hypothetical protein
MGNTVERRTEEAFMGALEITGLVVLGLIAIGIIVNAGDIVRYIRISTM